MKNFSSLISRKTSPFLTLILLSALVAPAGAQGQNARPNASRTGAQASQTGAQQRQAQRATNTPQRPGLLPRGSNAAGQQNPPAPQSGQGGQGTANATPQKESCVLRSSHRVGSADVVDVTMEASGEDLQTNNDG